MIKTYKKVINYAPTTVGASTQQYAMVTGIDSVAMGQVSGTDTTVPTGVKISRITVQFPIANLLASALIVHVAVQYTLGGQSPINANVVGGNAQRNQVIHQFVRSFGQFQNGSISYSFKVPRQFQRVKEGMIWHFTVTSSASATQTAQIIYTVKM